jgi:hypothetical protein
MPKRDREPGDQPLLTDDVQEYWCNGERTPYVCRIFPNFVLSYLGYINVFAYHGRIRDNQVSV